MFWKRLLKCKTPVPSRCSYVTRIAPPPNRNDYFDMCNTGNMKKRVTGTGIAPPLNKKDYLDM